ncbi:unnamed protein product [Cyclocybe aegerita]|uniref:Major facilitator superfamily (MFS) profile domain-containing protein n=1 Tax=Cyclocybe aegerita TaxID=1973307 RepID=A0A8S0XHL1_CYCAE|nr:unnamed protein product [Cyclocybe aegerita]
MGGLVLVLWGIRFFAFTLHESPKFLVGRGRDKEAVEVVHRVAEFNGTVSTLTVDDLRAFDYGGEKAATTPARRRWKVIKEKTRMFDGTHIKPLFETPTLARSTTMLIAIWGLIGLANTLYSSFVTYYLSTRGAVFGDGSVYVTYRNLVILSVIGLPGPLFSAYLIECRPLGRRRTLAISVALTGIFVLAATTARSSTVLLIWNCACGFTTNMTFSVLQTMTPELSPTRSRVTGIAMAAAVHRISGVMAPVIALYANLATAVPIYIAGAIFLVAAVMAILLPYESRGRASM